MYHSTLATVTAVKDESMAADVAQQMLEELTCTLWFVAIAIRFVTSSCMSLNGSHTLKQAQWTSVQQPSHLQPGMWAYFLLVGYDSTHVNMALRWPTCGKWQFVSPKLAFKHVPCAQAGYPQLNCCCFKSPQAMRRGYSGGSRHCNIAMPNLQAASMEERPENQSHVYQRYTEGPNTLANAECW